MLAIRNLLDLLDSAASQHGQKCFAAEDDSTRSLSFQELAAASHQVAAGLTGSLGIRPRDHVALLLPNCLSFLPIYFGILRAGAIAVPINTRLKPAELEFILADSSARALFVHPRTWKTAEAALASRPELRGRVVAVDFPEEDSLPEGVVSLSP